MQNTPPILLIHGLFGSLSAHAITAPFGDAESLAPDLLGYGSMAGNAPESWTLEDQADHLARWLKGRGHAEAHVVGHSIGGAIAMVYAHRYPEMTRTVTSIEGNFTLADAFWSAKLAKMQLAEIATLVESYKADVAAWLKGSIDNPSPVALKIASAWLDNQPPETLRNQARAVVQATENPSYLENVKTYLDSEKTLHLLAGSRSRSGWNVPGWVVERAASNNDIQDTGHLMMLEEPVQFANCIIANLHN